MVTDSRAIGRRRQVANKKKTSLLVRAKPAEFCVTGYFFKVRKKTTTTNIMVINRVLGKFRKNTQQSDARHCDFPRQGLGRLEDWVDIVGARYNTADREKKEQLDSQVTNTSK